MATIRRHSADNPRIEPDDDLKSAHIVPNSGIIVTTMENTSDRYRTLNSAAVKVREAFSPMNNAEMLENCKRNGDSP